MNSGSYSSSELWRAAFFDAEYGILIICNAEVSNLTSVLSNNTLGIPMLIELATVVPGKSITTIIVRVPSCTWAQSWRICSRRSPNPAGTVVFLEKSKSEYR